MSKVLPYLKAIYGAVCTSLASLLTAYEGTGHITLLTGLTALGTFLGALGVIWAVPNLPQPIKVALHVDGKKVAEHLVEPSRIGPKLEDK